VDAVELLRGDAPFIADTSAWWRVASLPSELGTLLQAAIVADRLWITPIVRMEILYSARSTSEYVELEAELDALRIVRNDRAVADAAMYALGELAERGDGYHRVPPTDAHRRGCGRARRYRGATPRCALRQARRGPHVPGHSAPRILNLVFPPRGSRVSPRHARGSSKGKVSRVSPDTWSGRAASLE
jgi:predicted nucleic acid-binding protein